MRIARIAGQVGGIRRMIEQGRPCLEVTGQISAVVAALQQVQLGLLAAHLRSSLPEALPARAQEVTAALAGTAAARRIRRSFRDVSPQGVANHHTAIKRRIAKGDAT